MQDKKWYTISGAAKYLGVSPDTLRRWEKARKVPSPTRTAGGARRYTKELLDEILGGGKKEKSAQVSQKKTSSSVSNKKTLIIGLITVIITLAILLPILLFLF
ncbi:MAG: helix-turn-helix domain-containing protein [Candidatus Marinimicrobia bacterium]|nr:helix-turn-helix domain-containing protein [Candidatus Neomarinimicrobiota bacterium]